MKKLALSLAVLFSVAMVSCGNSASTTDSQVDTTAPVVEEVVEVDTANTADTNNVDTAAPAPEA